MSKPIRYYVIRYVGGKKQLVKHERLKWIDEQIEKGNSGSQYELVIATTEDKLIKLLENECSLS